MANQTDSNPKRIDTAAALSGTHFIRQIQWVDLNEDIINSDELVMLINGVTVQCEVQVEVTANYGVLGPVVWNIGPFNPGIPVTDFEVVTIESGVVYVWT